MLNKLRRDHVELLVISGELRAIIDAPVLGDGDGLARLRGRLARIITGHLAVEDVHIYARLFADPRPEVQAIARRFKDEMRFLHGAFEAHVLRWTADALADDWPGYVAALSTLLDAIGTRIRCEEEELYPLLGDT